MHDKRSKNVELTLREILSYGTVRIECTGKNNHVTAGTGYVVEFEKDGDTNISITALITNKSLDSQKIITWSGAQHLRCYIIATASS